METIDDTKASDAPETEDKALDVPRLVRPSTRGELAERLKKGESCVAKSLKEAIT